MSGAQSEYLCDHVVQMAIASAVSKVVVKRADDPFKEISKLLLDASYEVPEGKAAATNISAAAYIESQGLTEMLAQVVTTIAKLQPAEPISEVGKLLAEGGSTTAASLAKGLSMRPSP
jgi:hypothetical protein